MDSVDSYIRQYDEPIQKHLIACRQLILTTIPDVEEKISWGVPTYYWHGYLLQFAANKKHLGFYLTPSLLQQFKEELACYDTNNKNTIRFPYHQELPLELIKQLIIARQKEKDVI